MNYVLIGPGGLTEGVLIHQKISEMQSQFSAAARAGDTSTAVKLLLSSPLQERHYADPLGNVSINTAQGSPEFCSIGTDLQSTIDQVRRGICRHPVARWLSKQIAQALPERVAEVEIGTGAQAALSRGATDLEAKRIIGVIRKTIRRARSSDDHTVVIVLCGAGSGGTGTGAFIEVLRMVRIIASELKHMTVVAMPVLGARGCEVLHDSQQELDALYSRTAGIYQTVCAGQAAPHAAPYMLDDGVVVEAKQLADIVWFVEGDIGDPSAPRREPMFGLARAAAGIIDALVAEQGALAGAIPAWRDKAGQAEPSACVGSAGAASARIDGYNLHQQAALLFAKAFYDAIVTRPAGVASEGESRAAQMLAGFAPATFVRALAVDEKVPWQPPAGDGIRTMAGLAEQITDHEGESGPFPCSPQHDVKWLPDEIHTSGPLNFWTVSNKDVVANSDATTEGYLGDPGAAHRREDDWTVRGWTAANRHRVVAEFKALLDAEMRARCVDPNTGLPYTLKQRPTALLDYYDLLSYLRVRIEKFRSEAQRVLESASPLLEQRATSLAQFRSELLDARKSGHLQRQFLKVAQEDLDVRVWQILVTTLIDVADGWIDCIDPWLDEVGETAGGWFSYVVALRDDVRARADELLAGRRKLECASNHVYVPQVGGAGEAALLEELVLSSGVLDQLRSECRFTWKLDEQGRPQLLLEGLAPAPEREREAVVRRFRDLGSSRALEYKLTNHTSADTLHHARRTLERPFQLLTVWDGWAYEYNHVEIPRAERERQTPDVEKWTRQQADRLLAGSKAELAVNGDGAGGVFRERVVWGPFTTSGMHPTAARIAEAFHAHLNDGTFPTIDVPANATVLRAFETVLRIPFDSIALYQPMMSCLARVRDEDLGLYAPEVCVRRAEVLRRVLERNGVKRQPWTFGPQATTLAADADGTDNSLRRTALGLAFDIFDVLPGKGTDPDRLGVVLEDRVLADFGDGTPIEIIEGLRNPSNARAVAEIDARIEDHVQGYRVRGGGISDALAGDLEAAGFDLWSEKLSSGTREEQDIFLLLVAEVLDLAEAYAAKAAKSSSPGSRHNRETRPAAQAPAVSPTRSRTADVSEVLERGPRSAVSWAGASGGGRMLA